jgi:hypothetical protein
MHDPQPKRVWASSHFAKIGKGLYPEPLSFLGVFREDK